MFVMEKLKFADGVCLFQNDDIFEILERTARAESSTTTKRPGDHPGPISLAEMNTYIARALLGLLLPVDSVSLREQSIGTELYELQRLLCPNPATKFIEVYNVNGTESSSSNARPGNSNPFLKSLISQVPRYAKGGVAISQFVTLNSLLVTRGQGSGSSLAR